MLRHERMLELHDRQYQYQWGFNEGLPSSIKSETIKDLPPNEQLQAEKYQGIKLNSFYSKYSKYEHWQEKALPILLPTTFRFVVGFGVHFSRVLQPDQKNEDEEKEVRTV